MTDTSYQPIPWIDTLIEEQHLLDGLVGICLNNGWTKVAEFTKVAYLNRLTKPIVRKLYLPLSTPFLDIPKTLNGDYHVYLDQEPCPSSYYTVIDKDEKTITLVFEAGVVGTVSVYYSSLSGLDAFDFYIAKHRVIRNASGNLFGIAQLGRVNEQLMYTGCKVPYAIPNPDSRYGTDMQPQDEGIFSWAIQKANEEGLFEGHSLYFYQLEKWIGNGLMLTGWDNDKDNILQRLALDVEVQTSMWGLNDSTHTLQHQISDKFPQMYQSPIVISHTRVPQLEHIDKLFPIDVKYTNWWNDSKVQVKGFIDGKSLMMIILADTAPIWGKNAVPAIPLYMGDFETEASKDEIVDREITFDFYKETKRQSTVISNRPMVNRGSFIRLWLMGDVNGDFPDEWVKVTVAGQEIGTFSIEGDKEPSTNKHDAQYLGQFDITNIEGKNSVTIEVESGTGVSGFHPVAARLWAEVIIQTDKGADGNPAALFSGTAATKEGANLEASLKASEMFDFDSSKGTQKVLLPVMKDYLHYPSNGLDSVMVKRTKLGARYQAHYIAWAVPSSSMPPMREDDKQRQYPRAWNQYSEESYLYQFNPSRYSDKVHSSRPILVHPEDGKFGTLRNVILTSPLTIMNGDELITAKDQCAPEEKDRYELYSYYLVEGLSPLTKKPATAYRPAGLGILKSGYVLPEIPPPPPSPPAFEVYITPTHATIEEGESVQFTSTYSMHSPITNFKWTASSNVNKGSYSVDNAMFTFNVAGTYTIKFTIWNEFGQMGSAMANVVVNEKPLPPPPPPPPPPPNTLQCGKTNDTGGGAYTEKYHEMGTVAGEVRIDYDMYGLPDRMDVYYMNQLLASTNAEVTYKGSLKFTYRPIGGVTQIKVVITNSTGNSSWEYLVHCPV